jgi:integrase
LAGTSTLKAICESFLTREGGMVRHDDGTVTFAGGKIRTANERRKTFERLVYPTLGKRPINEIRRSDINALLDRIEDKNGGPMADHTLAYLRRVFSWHAARTDDFLSPFTRGMARTKPTERTRDRVLSDQELRDVWAALDIVKNVPVCYPAYMRTLLLTAMRRTEVSGMTWLEHEGDIWVCPAHRMKGKRNHVVSLIPAIREIIGEQPADAKNRPFVFSSDGGERAFSGFSKAKQALDKAIAALRKGDGRKPMPGWQLHDLRRTARTLMEGAGVRPDIAERVLAHKIPRVQGVYNQYQYLAEKRDALERLAALVARIINPADNVVSISERQAAAGRRTLLEVSSDLTGPPLAS